MWLLILHIIVVLSFGTRILLRTDLTPPARFSWIVVVILLPIFGCLIYFLFGESDIGQKAAKQYKSTFQALKDAHPKVLGETDGKALEAVDEAYHQAFRYAASINGFNTMEGNRATLMADAKTARQSLIDDIDNAKDYVHILYYIWIDDNTGRDTALALIKAAKRGVKVRAIADGLGSRFMVNKPLWNEMKEAGIELHAAMPLNNLVQTFLTSRIDLRNHRKITIIDSKITYCGSQNCADAEYSLKPDYAPWVDILLRIEGPVVAQNQLLFLSDWMFASNDSKEPQINWPEPKKVKGFPAQIIGDGPTERKRATPQLFSALMAAAKNTLTISTPYFVPNGTVMDGICSAAYRGIDTIMIFPKRNDSWIVAAASRSYYQTLLEAGVKIFEYKGGLLHSKTLTMDNQVTLLGSTNMDLRSFDLNYENDLLLSDKKLTKQIEARQQHYLEQCDPVSLEEVKAWSIHKRLWNNIWATLGPLL